MVLEVQGWELPCWGADGEEPVHSPFEHRTNTILTESLQTVKLLKAR